MKRHYVLKIVALVSAATLILLGGTYLFGGFEGVSGHGIGALIVGVVFSLALGVGLMVLMYASHHGHDDAAHHAAREHFTGPLS
jgi:uncharacterized membrane protein